MTVLPDNPLPLSALSQEHSSFTETEIKRFTVLSLLSRIPSDDLMKKFMKKYFDLAELPLSLIKREFGGGKEEHLVKIPEINGKDLNHLLYFAAPEKSKYFGLDTDDIVADWTELFDQMDSEQVSRLVRHQTIPGFAEFIKFRKKLLKMITDYQVLKLSSKNKKPTRLFYRETIKPVIRVENVNDTLSIKIDSPEEAVGALFLAAFSPEITNTWPRRERYVNIPDSRATNPIGPTQVIVKVLAEKDALLVSELGSKITHYIKTGGAHLEQNTIVGETQAQDADWIFYTQSAHALLGLITNSDSPAVSSIEDDEDF